MTVSGEDTRRIFEGQGSNLLRKKTATSGKKRPTRRSRKPANRENLLRLTLFAWYKHMIRLLPLIFLFLTQAISAEEPFRTYTNSRFNYSIDYPPNILIPKGEAPNGDGQIFESPDGQARMIIYGTHNVLEQSIQDVYRKESQDASTPQITKQVTYKRQKDNWFVVSGYIGPKIFYQKTFLSNDMFKSFYIEYPVSQRHLYDPILSRLGRSFKG